MKKVVAWVALAMIVSLGSTPASAADGPEVPRPTWWTDAMQMRFGQWLPCIDGWAKNDCIEKFEVRREDQPDWKPLTFAPDPGFNPATARQAWRGDAVQPQNYPYWVNAFPGYWWLPESEVPAGGERRIELYAATMPSEFQVLMVPPGGTGNLSERHYLRVTIRSSGLQPHVGWTLSTTHDPSVTMPDAEHVVFTVLPTKIYSLSSCEGDGLKQATTDTVSVIVGTLWRRDPQSTPGEVVIGTNGTWCFGGMDFDNESSQLRIKAGTAHRDASGEVIKGWLEAKIRGDLVKRWWNVRPQLIAGSAKVEVFYQDGTSTIATTAASYDVKNDWIDLRSYGFTYSKPTIGVKVIRTEENQVQPTPTPTPTPSVKPAKKVKLTCVKGKSVKKVTSTKPTCPAGWKRKG